MASDQPPADDVPIERPGMNFLTATQNIPFTVALTLLVLVALVQGIGLLIGGLDSFSFGADTDAAPLEGVSPDFSADAPGADALADVGDMGEAGDLPDGTGANSTVSSSLAGSVLAWLQIGRLPTMVVLILFLASFGIGGLVLQKIVLAMTGSLLPATFAALPVTVAAFFATGKLGAWIAPIIPRDETEAFSVDSFLGLNATVLRGTASNGQPAEAKLTDPLGHAHYVMVEPRDPTLTFRAGELVQLILRRGACFLAIPASPDITTIQQITTNQHETL